MAYNGQLPAAMRLGAERKRYRDVPELNPEDAGFIREVGLPNFAASAQHNAARTAQRAQAQLSERHHQQQRRRLTPSVDQTAAAAAATPSPPPMSARQRGPEGVLADGSDDDEAFLAASAAVAGDAGDSATAAAAPNDTEAALRLLHGQFPLGGRAAGLPPIMLKSQLYTVVADRTAVDRELDELRRSGVVRVFKLASGTADEYAFMFTDDYQAVVGRQRSVLAAKPTPAAQLAALDWFLESVMPGCPEVTIPHRRLLALLAQPAPAQPASVSADADASEGQPLVYRRPRRRRGGGSASGGAPGPYASAQTNAECPAAGPTAPPTDRRAASASHVKQRSSAAPSGAASGSQANTLGNEAPHKVTEAHISLLLNAGLLARHGTDRGLYLFGVPDTGPLVKSMAKGRAEILGAVSRKKYGEMFEREWAGRKLQRSLLDARFHIRDLIGHGELERVETTAGHLLRAIKRT